VIPSGEGGRGSGGAPWGMGSNPGLHEAGVKHLGGASVKGRPEGELRVAPLTEQAEACSVLPLESAVADMRGGNAGAAEAYVGCPDYGDAQVSPHIATNPGVGLLPLLREVAGEPLEEEVGLSADEAVRGADKRSEVSALVQASLEVLLLLLLLLRLEDLLGLPGAVRRCVRVRDADIEDAVGLLLPKATDE